MNIRTLINCLLARIIRIYGKAFTVQLLSRIETLKIAKHIFTLRDR